MMRRFLLVLLVFLLGACTPAESSPDTEINTIQVVESDVMENTEIETVHLNNCGGKGDTQQTASRSISIHIGGEIGVKLGYEVVEGSVVAKYGQSRDATKSITIVAPAGTNMEVVLQWTERTWLGEIVSGNNVGTYSMSVPIAVEQISSRDLGCDNMQTSSDVTSVTPTAQQSVNIFEATTPIEINNVAYEVPLSNSSIACVASEQTGYTNQGHNYSLKVPSGWVIVWDSWKAYWPSGSYDNDGLLIIYGPWEGEITVVNGEYCATPVEWADFAINNRRNASPKPNRQEFILGYPP